MSTSDPLDARVLQHKTLLLLVIAVSAAFAWILWPFYGAILWAATCHNFQSALPPTVRFTAEQAHSSCADDAAHHPPDCNSP